MDTTLIRGVLAQSDIGEIIPFLIFVIVIVSRLFKTLSERARGAGRMPMEEDEDASNGADPLRRFLEDLRRQAESMNAPPSPPAAPPPAVSVPTAPRPAHPRPAPAAVPPPRPTITPRNAPRVVPQPLSAMRQAPSDALRQAAAKAATPPRKKTSAKARKPAATIEPLEEPSNVLLTALLRQGATGLRQAVVLREVLGPPLAMRPPASGGIGDASGQ